MPPHKSEKIQLPSCNYLISSLTYALSRRRVRKGGGEEEQQGAPESPHDADDDLLLRELQLNPPRSNLLRGPLVTDDKSDDHEHRVFPTGRTPAGSWHRHRGGRRCRLPKEYSSTSRRRRLEMLRITTRGLDSSFRGMMEKNQGRREAGKQKNDLLSSLFSLTCYTPNSGRPRFPTRTERKALAGWIMDHGCAGAVCRDCETVPVARRLAAVTRFLRTHTARRARCCCLRPSPPRRRRPSLRVA